MALRLEQKQAIVEELREAADGAVSAVLADYRGLTAGEETALRRKARDSGVYVRVVANKLLRRAVVGTDYECLHDAATGPTMLAFSNEDLGAAARLFKEAAAELDALQVKAVAIGGEVLPPEDIDKVASLPTRHEALAMLASVMQAPIAKLVRTLGEVPAKLVRTVAAVGARAEAGAADGGA